MTAIVGTFTGGLVRSGYSHEKKRRYERADLGEIRPACRDSTMFT